MSIVRTLDDLPEINILEDEGITLDSIMNEMVVDFEEKYKEATGKEITLYPADDNRIKLNVVAGELFQMYNIIQNYFRQNFCSICMENIL